MGMLVCGFAMALGTFVAVSPDRAAKIWGSERLGRMNPERKAAFLFWYRVFGILLYLAGALIAADAILFPNYYR